MSKRIESKNKRFTGFVTISDPLSIPQVMQFEEAIEGASRAAVERGDCISVKGDGGEEKKRVNVMDGRYLYDVLSGVCACVEKWELSGFPENVTPDNFPGSPKKDSARVIHWLIDEIMSVYLEAESVPNA